MATNTAPAIPTPGAPSTRRPARSKLRAAAAATSVVALGGALALGSSAAGAATIGVTTTADGGPGSLRAAIDQANASPGPDVIQVPAGTYSLSTPGTWEDGNATGDLDVVGDVTIVGAGSGATVLDGAGIDRVLHVHSGAVTLQALTVSGGDSGPGTTTGGGIRHESGDLRVVDSVVRANRAWSGGGIVSYGGTLTVLRTEVVDNTVESEPGNGSHGGGISKAQSKGSLVIDSSLIAGNTAVGGNAGGLYSNAPSITVVNSTFTGNQQYANTIALERYTATPGTARFAFVTVAGNTSTGAVGGLATNVGQGYVLDLTLEGVLLQDNATPYGPGNCGVQSAGTIASLGGNLADDDSCPLTGPGDLPNETGTTLGGLADNGGATRTMALVPGSSAVDAAACSASAATDQRGAPRPAGSACDIGAFELGAQAPPATPVPTIPEPTVPDPTTPDPTTPDPTTPDPATPDPTTPDATTPDPTTPDPTTPDPTTPDPTTPDPTTPDPTTPDPTTPDPSVPEASTPDPSTPDPTTPDPTTPAPTTTAVPATSTPSTTTTAGPAPTAAPPTTADGGPAVLSAGAVAETTGTLPVTGPEDTARLLLVAFGLLAGGFAVLLGSRRVAGQRLADELGEGASAP